LPNTTPTIVVPENIKFPVHFKVITTDEGKDKFVVLPANERILTDAEDLRAELQGETEVAHKDDQAILADALNDLLTEFSRNQKHAASKIVMATNPRLMLTLARATDE
jgi:hypothetical protein